MEETWITWLDLTLSISPSASSALSCLFAYAPYEHVDVGQPWPHQHQYSSDTIIINDTDIKKKLQGNIRQQIHFFIIY